MIFHSDISHLKTSTIWIMVQVNWDKAFLKNWINKLKNKPSIIIQILTIMKRNTTKDNLAGKRTLRKTT